MYADETGNSVGGQVLWVMPDSPADKAGLKRGDFITSAEGVELTDANYIDYYYEWLYPESGAKATLKYIKGNETIGDDYTTTVLTAEEIPQNPIVYSSVIARGEHKVGYLVYTAFERGYDRYGATTEYDNEMKKIFGDFKTAGVDQLVIDLRYNGGGFISSCQLLTSLAANKTGQVFAKLKYNSDLAKMNDTEMKFTAQANSLGLQKIYVLETEYSASASEMVISALRGVDVEVVHIGTTTEGKNVGMDPMTNTFGAYTYDFNPITFQIFNAKDFSDYANGFTPDYEHDELYDWPWYDFGNENEVLLGIALDLIEGREPAAMGKSRSSVLAPRQRAVDMPRNLPKRRWGAISDYRTISPSK
jgi:C-terminal processing protease CtpA/Prc